MMEIFLGVLLIIAVIFLIPLYHSFAWGFVFWNYYWWFVLPVIPSAPDITYLAAVGLALFAGLFKNQNTYNDIPEDEKLRHLGYSFVRPWCALLLGYVINLIIL